MRFQIILDNILIDHPTWVSAVEAWKNTSAEDKVWLLWLHELYQIGIDLPEIDSFIEMTDLKTPMLTERDKDRLIKFHRESILQAQDFKERIEFLKENNPLYSAELAAGIIQEDLRCAKFLNRSFHQPSPRSVELLQQKSKIDKALAEIKEVKIPRNADITKLTNGISLLRNLQNLTICSYHLRKPPNVKANKHLEVLILVFHKELESAPDLTQNKQLKVLHIKACNLKVAPDLSQNPNLKELDLSDNQIQQAPNLSQNNHLAYLFLGRNQLSLAPDISHNPNLEQLDLTNNRLIASPIIDQKQSLILLALEGNPLDKTTYPQIAAIAKQHPKCGITADSQCIHAIENLLKKTMSPEITAMLIKKGVMFMYEGAISK